MSIIMFGIKNCDTIKKARNFLQSHQIDYQFHDYKTDGVPGAVLSAAAAQLGWDKLINRKGTTWRQLSGAQQQLSSDADYLALCQQLPSIIKRPLLQHATGYHLGFQADDYAQIFGVS